MSSIQLDVGWTIHGNHPNNPRTGKSLYVWGGAPYADPADANGRAVHGLLMARMRIPEVRAGHPDADSVLPQVELLWREIEPLFPSTGEIKTEAGPVPMSYLHHVVRRVSVVSPGESPVTDELFHSAEPYFNGECCSSGGPSVPVARIRDLSSVARSAVRKLDGYAAEQLFRSYSKAVREISSNRPLPGAPPLAKAKVFVSYRKPRVAVARRVYDMLREYGNCAFFDPYLDDHDSLLGDWKAQFEDEVRSADLFMAICTDDYAAAGSVSAFELDVALRCLAPEQIAVVRIGSGPSAGWARLEHLNACMFEREEDFDDGKLGAYLRKCAQSAIGRSILAQPPPRPSE